MFLEDLRHALEISVDGCLCSVSIVQELIIFGNDSFVRYGSAASEDHDLPPGGERSSQCEEFSPACARSNSVSTNSSHKWRYGARESGQ